MNLFVGRDLRSLENTVRAYVRFENKTGRSIDVVWINYNGALVRYGILQPSEFMDINTFKTHPWVFIDRKTGEMMRAGSSGGTVFYPRSSREISQRLGLNLDGDFRVPIPIFLPMLTLRRISIHAVLRCVRDINRLDCLELPSGLVSEIQHVNQTKETFMGMYDST